MQRIDEQEYRKRIEQISGLFSGMIQHAGELSTVRCPYKNRFDQCTAKFGCRNQGKPTTPGGPLVCSGDDKLDYRSAWESA